MSRTVAVLLEQARATRERAQRTRWFTQGLSTPDVAADLLRYAREYERTADELEARACALAETIAATHVLSADIRLRVAEARERLRAPSRT